MKSLLSKSVISLVTLTLLCGFCFSEAEAKNKSFGGRKGGSFSKKSFSKKNFSRGKNSFKSVSKSNFNRKFNTQKISQNKFNGSKNSFTKKFSPAKNVKNMKFNGSKLSQINKGGKFNLSKGNNRKIGNLKDKMGNFKGKDFGKKFTDKGKHFHGKHKWHHGKKWFGHHGHKGHFWRGKYRGHFHRPWNAWWYTYYPRLHTCRPVDYRYCDWNYVRSDYITTAGTPVQDARWYLGVQGLVLPGRGLGIEQVEPGSPAEQAGLQQGMVITKVNGLELTTEEVMGQVMETSNGYLEMEVVNQQDGQMTPIAVQMTQMATTTF